MYYSGFDIVFRGRFHIDRKRHSREQNTKIRIRLPWENRIDRKVEP